jgi:hypothetical protein
MHRAADEEPYIVVLPRHPVGAACDRDHDPVGDRVVEIAPLFRCAIRVASSWKAAQARPPSVSGASWS